MKIKFVFISIGLVTAVVLLAFFGFLACTKKTVRSSAEPMLIIEKEEVVEEAFLISAESKTNVKRKKDSISTWKRSHIVANTSRLMIGDDEELPLKGMQVNVLIEGFRARVVIDTYYFNPHDRQYEGAFKLRLPDGANPYFFAFGEMTITSEVDFNRPIFMSQKAATDQGISPEAIMAARQDSWSAPKQARMVPREKAVLAYGETVRRSVDPALMEWSGPGIFSARVFPLLPKKLHRIVMGYEVGLLPVGNDYEYRLDLPPDIPQSVVDLSVTEIPNSRIAVTPDVKLSDTVGNDISEVPGKYYHRFENPEAETILVRLINPGTMMLTGTDIKTSNYFATSFRPNLPSAPFSTASDTSVFLVDISLSSNPDQFNIYLKLIEAILNNNRDAIRKFAVLFFNIETFWWQDTFTINNAENVSELIRFANQLSLEGATDIGAALKKAMNPDWSGVDIGIERRDIFLLSDGAVTWGQSDLFALSQILKGGQSNALFAFRTGFSGSNITTLNHLARESGGAVFSVVGESEIESASRAHRAQPWQIEGVRLKGCNDLLLAGRPLTIYPGQILNLAGRGTPGPEAQIILSLRRGNKSITVPTTITHALATPLAARTYGLIAVGQLESFGHATLDTSKAYATYFRITGKTDSLLMLETEEDYKRFNINPEENAFVVKSTSVAATISSTLQQIGKLLGDPKVAFLNWLEKMEKQPGFAFEIPAALKLVLRDMPPEAFMVETKPLTVVHRTWEGIPAKVKNQLATKKLEYDTLNDEAARRFKAYGASDALRALSSLVENNPGDTVLCRDIAYASMNWGLPGHAYHLLRRVAELRPYEPQTYRDMARVLEESNRIDLALIYYEIGLIGHWNERFGEFRRIHGIDYLRFLEKIVSGRLPASGYEYAQARIETVASQFDPGNADLLVSITWNTDYTDVDLHVVEPTGETCFYENPKTKIGGLLTRDVTQGYGPEMYILPKAKAGTYIIRVKYYASNANRAGTRTKVSATVFEDWGTDHETVAHKTVTLRTGKEMHELMVVKITK
jgi:hypothetical protein